MSSLEAALRLRGWPVAAGEMLAEQIQMTVLSVLKIGPFKPGGSRGHLGGLPPYSRKVGASMFLLAHDADGLDLLF